MSIGKINNIEDLNKIKDRYEAYLNKYKYQVLVCSGAGCVSSNCSQVKEAVANEIQNLGLQDKAIVYETGCMGTCAVGPVMLILPERIFYTSLTPAKAKEIIRAHLLKGEILTQYTFYDV